MWYDNQKRYFILCHNYDLDSTFLIGRNRHRVKSLTDGYIDFKRACYTCDYIYRHKVGMGYNVACSVISIDI